MMLVWAPGVTTHSATVALPSKWSEGHIEGEQRQKDISCPRPHGYMSAVTHRAGLPL